MRALPIDPLLPDITETVRKARTLVLEAEPGAGKTTRVPRSLLDARLERPLVVVAEPRRLPARLAAGFVAAELGERVGQTVGYAVRFESASSKDTRVLYVTEGVLLRRMLDDTTLSDVGAVVLDEFHERHLTTDLLLALVDRLQRGARPDLRLVVMSATLEAAALAAHLGAPRIHCTGRAFPLTVEHEPRPDDRPLERKVVSAVKRVLAEEPDGDVLVFVPGAREIRRCLDALAADPAVSGTRALPLHGDLSVSEQAKAVEPSKERRIIVSTNVAESSVTIEGVTAVVDTGLARIAGHSPWSGLPTLATAKISRASATQRAGRAGRTRAGRVVRLYTSGDLATRPEHDKPEILRNDLAEAFLGLHGAGVTDPAELRWLDPPPAVALTAAESLLRRLGALDAERRLSDVGRRMLAFPLPPRLARVVVEGERRGVAAETCLAVALLSERDLRTDARANLQGGRARARDASGPSDVLELIERFDEMRDANFDARRGSVMGLDARTAKSVERAAKQLSRIARSRADRPSDRERVDRAISMALLAGFPDRLARRRSPGEPALVLWSGKTARLADTSVVHDAQLMVALDAEDSGRGAVVRLASGVEADWLFELYPDSVEMTDELVFNAANEQVDRVSRIASGSVVLDEERRAASPSAEASAVLAGALRTKGPSVYDPEDRARALFERLAALRREVPEAALPDVGAEILDAALTAACAGKTRLSEVRGADLGAFVHATLGTEQRALLAREAPERVSLPGGRNVTVHYEAGKPPWIESRLQDFFGMTKTPRVFKGRVPLTVHLLAPNQRAVQVTTDLAGFWERHYPAIRRELCRRYPRHPWPEDGRAATPPPPKPPSASKRR